MPPETLPATGRSVIDESVDKLNEFFRKGQASLEELSTIVSLSHELDNNSPLYLSEDPASPMKLMAITIPEPESEHVTLLSSEETQVKDEQDNTPPTSEMMSKTSLPLNVEERTENETEPIASEGKQDEIPVVETKPPKVEMQPKPHPAQPRGETRTHVSPIRKGLDEIKFEGEPTKSEAQKELEKYQSLPEFDVKRTSITAPNGKVMNLLTQDVQVYSSIMRGDSEDQTAELCFPGKTQSERLKLAYFARDRIKQQLSQAGYWLTESTKGFGNRQKKYFTPVEKEKPKGNSNLSRNDIEAVRPPNPTIGEQTRITPVTFYKESNVNPFIRLKIKDVTTPELLTDKNGARIIEAYLTLREIPTIENLKRSFELLFGNNFEKTFSDMNELMAKKWKIVFKLEWGKQGVYLRLVPHREGVDIFKIANVKEPTPSAQNPAIKKNVPPPPRSTPEDSTKTSSQELRDRDAADPRRVEGDNRIPMWLAETLIDRDVEILMKYRGISSNNMAPISEISIEDARRLNAAIEIWGFKIIEHAPHGRIVSTYLRKLY